MNVGVSLTVGVPVCVSVAVEVNVAVDAGATEKVRVSLRLLPNGQITSVNHCHGCSASSGRTSVAVYTYRYPVVSQST